MMDASARTIASFVREARSFDPDESVYDAEQALAAARVTALPVVDAENRLLGTISQKELAMARIEPPSAEETGELMTTVDAYADLEKAPSSARATSVSDVMNRSPVVIEADTSVDAAARLMSEAGVHEVPVLRHGVLVGIVSALEVLDLVGAGESEPS